MRRVVAVAGALALLLALAAGAGGAAAARTKPFVAIDHDAAGAPVARGVRAASGRVLYHGGSVLHSNRTHVVFWQPSRPGLSFDSGYEALVERFVAGVAAASHSTTNVYGLSGQYGDGFGPAAYAYSYAGAVVATDPLPASDCQEPSTAPPGWTACLTDAQLQSELEHVVAGYHLPRTASDVYLLLTPNGFGNCLDSSSRSCALGGADHGYCAYHSQTGGGILYAVLPYNAVQGHCNFSDPRPNGSTADPELSTVAHEQAEVATDPSGDDGWFASDGLEIADLCLHHFGRALGGSGARAWNESISGGHYYLQELWSNDNGGCAARPDPDRVSFSVPAHARVGRRVVFTARASDRHGAIMGYAWSFPGRARSGRRRASHVFRRPGRYKVVLRVTDSAGNWAFATRMIRVTWR
jgi:hypothetical protein